MCTKNPTEMISVLGPSAPHPSPDAHPGWQPLRLTCTALDRAGLPSTPAQWLALLVHFPLELL